jgi:hypothetical protein
MSYKPDERDFMAYLYNEMESPEKEKFERYLLENPEAQKNLAGFQRLSHMMGAVKDKEVIAPPIVIGDVNPKFNWNAPYLKTILSIAASLILIILVGRVAGIQASFAGNEFKLSFGEPKETQVIHETPSSSLTAQEVQTMINSSLNQNNLAMQTNWKQTQDKLDASVRTNLAVNSAKINELVQQASTASQDQIRQFVAGMQSQNSQVMKDYFQLTSTEQKKYIENLLVDFSKYLQQQRTDDLQLVQSRLNNLEQNTDMFKQETEQILSSIITSVGSNSTPGTTNTARY